jgi:hypothetical protein
MILRTRSVPFAIQVGYKPRSREPRWPDSGVANVLFLMCLDVAASAVGILKLALDKHIGPILLARVKEDLVVVTVFGSVHPL